MTRSAHWLLHAALACSLACQPAEIELHAPTYISLSPALDLRLNAVDSKYIVGEAGTLLVDDTALPDLPALALHGVLDCLVSSCSDYAVGEDGLVLTRESGSGDWQSLVLDSGATLHDIARVGDDIVVIGDGVVRVWDEWEGPASGFDPAPPDAAGWGRLHDFLAYTAVGDAGTILTTPDLHTWARSSSGTSVDLLALGYYDPDPTDLDPGELWAVGRQGTVLRRPADAPQAPWTPLDFGLDSDLLDYAGGYAITHTHELLRLSADGAHELISRFDRTPRALDLAVYERTIVTVVGDAGLIAEVDLGPNPGI